MTASSSVVPVLEHLRELGLVDSDAFEQCQSKLTQPINSSVEGNGPPPKPGDWVCPSCSGNNFRYRTQCYICGKAKPTDLGSPDVPTAGRPGDWVCPCCGFLNFGSRQQCRQCLLEKSSNAAIATLASPVPPGPVPRPGDWTCPSCNFVNFATRLNCRTCLYAKPGPMAQVLCAEPPSARAGDWVCPNCQTLNFSSRFRCYKCASAKDSARAPVDSVPPPRDEAVYGRQWRNIDSANASGSGVCGLRILTYNILAKQYFRPKFPAPYFEWPHRSKLILHQLGELKADLGALQENDQRLTTFEPFLSELGYSTAFLQRPSEVDGLGVFFNPEKLSLVRRKEVFYEEDCHIQTHNVAILLEFEILDHEPLECAAESSPKPRRFVFVTTHLHWDPRREDIKVKQAVLLLNAVREFMEEVSGKNGGVETQDTQKAFAQPVIICGDFNSMPTSAVYKLFAKCFSSAYAAIGDPNTNFTHDFTGCLDYIWISKEHWCQKTVLEPPKASGPFPDWHVPSDHIPLVCEVELA